jgi:hypothetical protein
MQRLQSTPPLFSLRHVPAVDVPSQSTHRLTDLSFSGEFGLLSGLSDASSNDSVVAAIVCILAGLSAGLGFTTTGGETRVPFDRTDTPL